MQEEREELPLVWAARRYRAGAAAAEELLETLRTAELHLEDLGSSVPVVRYGGLAWVPVCSTRARLRAYLAARDHHLGTPQGRVWSGRDLLAAHAHMPAVGLVLDPLADHVLALPVPAPPEPDPAGSALSTHGAA